MTIEKMILVAATLWYAKEKVVSRRLTVVSKTKPKEFCQARTSSAWVVVSRFHRHRELKTNRNFTMVKACVLGKVE